MTAIVNATLIMIETERLLLRPHTLLDLDASVEFHSDPAVRSFSGDKPDTAKTSEIVCSSMRVTGHYLSMGFSRHSIEKAGMWSAKAASLIFAETWGNVSTAMQKPFGHLRDQLEVRDMTSRRPPRSRNGTTSISILLIRFAKRIREMSARKSSLQGWDIGRSAKLSTTILRSRCTSATPSTGDETPPGLDR